MRIFETQTKRNFVDTNDVFVGFSGEANQDCCEDFGWFFAKKEPTGYTSYNEDTEKVDSPPNLEDLTFDKDYFKQHDSSWGGGYAVFRLVDNITGSNEELFLVLYNHHNGYYGHGFTVKHGGETVREGIL